MLCHPLKNNRGLALIFMVLLFTAAATAVVMFISLGVKVKGIQKEGTTQQRLNEIRTALQNYYLIHYDLPDPSLTTPVNSVPTVRLNLPQKYRFDSNGQRIWYDRLTRGEHMTTVRNIHVHGNTDQNLVAAVLVAPGPDKQISTSNQGDPYGTAGSDDLVLEVSLEAEALKIANHTVGVLQQAAKAYDAIFYDKNNDADTLFLPPVDTLSDTGWTPGTEWFDYTLPVLQTGEFAETPGHWDSDGDGCFVRVSSSPDDPAGSWTRTDVNVWHPNYAGDLYHRTCDDESGNVYTEDDVFVPPNDEDVVPRPIYDALHQEPTEPHLYPGPDEEVPVILYDENEDESSGEMRNLERPIPLVDEGEQVDTDIPIDGITDIYDYYPEATGDPDRGQGQGCIWYGVLTNDPSRGVFSLDKCNSRTPALDLAAVYGLNLIKLGYDAASNSLLDPWGNRYQWGVSGDIYLAQPMYYPIQPEPDINGNGVYDEDDDVLRDPHYWTFYSLGPDGLSSLGADGRPNTGDENPPDDILPPTDRIRGYWDTPQIPNPLP